MRGSKISSHLQRESPGKILEDAKEEFRNSLCESVGRVKRDPVLGEQRRMHDEAEAERLLIQIGGVAVDLTRLDLLKKGALWKGLFAWCLSKNTSAGQKWIAKGLETGDLLNVIRLVRLIGRTKDSEIIK